MRESFGDKSVRLEDIQRWAEAQDYYVEVGGNPHNIRLIGFGEIHRNKPDLQKTQESFIEMVKPPAILHESLMAHYYVNGRIRRKENRYHINVDDMNAAAVQKKHSSLFEIADRLQIPIIGCDLSYGEQWGGEDPFQSRNDERIEDVTPSLARDFKRDEEMVKVLTEETTRRGLVVAILGQWHTRGIHVDKLLEESLGPDIGYVIIDQTRKANGDPR